MRIHLRSIDRIFILVFLAVSLPIILLYTLFGQTIPEERLPAVAYLGNPLESPEIWQVAMDGSGRQPLTTTGGKIFDFSVSPEGETIVFSMLNESGGSDLYRIDRDGQSQEILVECGRSHCVQPVWQVDAEIIAYSQYLIGLESDAVIHLIDVETIRDYKIPTLTNLEGAYPVFSPDGNYVAYYSFRNNAMNILDLSSGEEIGTVNANPGYASWSRDSGELFFTSTVMNGIIPQSRLYKFDLSNNEAMPYLAAELAGYDAAQIEWSPDGGLGVFGLKDTDSQAGRQIYLVRKDGSDLQAITQDAGISHTAYHWSPTGEQIIYQRYSFGSVDMTPQIVVWDRTTNTSTILTRDGALPVWLP